MKHSIRLLALGIVLLVLHPVQAQDIPVSTANTLDMELDFLDGVEGVAPAYNQLVILRTIVTDQSRDAAGGTGQAHYFTVTAEPISDDEGWQYFLTGTSFTLISGQSKQVDLKARAVGGSTTDSLRIKLNITMETQACCASTSREVTFVFKTPGSLVPQARATSPVSSEVRPDSTFDLSMSVRNPGLRERSYSVSAVSNGCDLFITDAVIVVPAGETREVTLTAIAPSGKLYYLQETCIISLQAKDQKLGTTSNSITYNVKVQGVFVDPGWVINAILFLAIAGGIIWLILIAKRRAEEEILGKPQPPWTLPAEQVYLEELEKKDPRAAYVVRNFLMEDEYQSSLLWYKAFKRATRGRRAMERRVLKMEHAFEKWDRKQQELLDRSDEPTERKVAKLQAKLDRKTRKSHKKEHKKWSKEVSKMEAKATNDHNKAMGEWRKEAKKAKKKGEPVPKEPTMPKLDLPPEPEHEPVSLDEHKWVAKKERILARGARAQEKAYEDYEKHRAKRLAIIEKKFAKMADKIDDPEFISEHPLLQEAAANAA